MIGRLLTSVAAAAVLTGAVLIGTAGAQMTAPPATNPTANPSASPSASGAAGATGAPTRLKASPQSGGQKMMLDMRDASHGGGSAASGSSGMSADRQTAQGHEQSNVADKLNACEAKPMSQRQACIDAATRM